MSTRGRTGILLGVVLALVAASLVVAIGERDRSRDLATREPGVASTSDHPSLEPRTLVFRHTGRDREYGIVATIPLSDPQGPRAFTDLACDRVDAVVGRATCLHLERGVRTATTATDVDGDWSSLGAADLTGIPSRTRLSPDGTLAAATAFVAGHSYLSDGFSTATTVRVVGDDTTINLERFDVVDPEGRSIAPRDRNLWGVTFIDDDAFFATAAWGGRTYLVRGDLDEQRLSVVGEDVECPSLSPDGRRLAFKQAHRRDGRIWWTPAVLDLASGERSVLDEEQRNIDDQIAWLDDDSILYGVPREADPGVTDVWSLDVADDAAPVLFLPEAWSPAVVR